jgi:hypothetical protein
MTQQDYRHPITPPPELVQQWWDDFNGAFYEFKAITTKVFQAGADQELEACCEWIKNYPWAEHVNRHLLIEAFRSARRPRPPSLKEQALETLQRLSKDGYPCNYQEDSDWDTIRCALEQLDD